MPDAVDSVGRPDFLQPELHLSIGDFDGHEHRYTGMSCAIHAGANVKTIQCVVGHAPAAMTLDVHNHCSRTSSTMPWPRSTSC